MFNLNRIITLSASAGLLMLVLGCGGGPKLYPVKGTLNIDGSPAKAGVLVELHPLDPSDNDVGTGKTADGGSFEIVSGLEGKRGAGAGKYRVVLKMAAPSYEDAMKAMQEQGEAAASAGGNQPPPSGPPPTPPPVFHSKYGNALNSDMDVTIEAKSNSLTLEAAGPEA